SEDIERIGVFLSVRTWKESANNSRWDSAAAYGRNSKGQHGRRRRRALTARREGRLSIGTADGLTRTRHWVPGPGYESCWDSVLNTTRFSVFFGLLSSVTRFPAQASLLCCRGPDIPLRPIFPRPAG